MYEYECDLAVGLLRDPLPYSESGPFFTVAEKAHRANYEHVMSQASCLASAVDHVRSRHLSSVANTNRMSIVVTDSDRVIDSLSRDSVYQIAYISPS